MGTTAKIRHRRQRREKAERLNRWFTKAEIDRSGLTRFVRVLAWNEQTDEFFLDRNSAERIRNGLRARG